MSDVAWAEVRDDSNVEVDWLIAGYEGDSKTDITVLAKGSGGIDDCSKALPEGLAVFGGCRLRETGRFVTFYYADEGAPVMMKGRASMHKNGACVCVCVCKEGIMHLNNLFVWQVFSMSWRAVMARLKYQEDKQS